MSKNAYVCNVLHSWSQSEKRHIYNYIWHTYIFICNILYCRYTVLCGRRKPYWWSVGLKRAWEEKTVLTLHYSMTAVSTINPPAERPWMNSERCCIPFSRSFFFIFHSTHKYNNKSDLQLTPKPVLYSSSRTLVLKGPLKCFETRPFLK